MFFQISLGVSRLAKIRRPSPEIKAHFKSGKTKIAVSNARINPDYGDSRKPRKRGSSITSIIGSFSSVNPEVGESQTSLLFGVSHIGFVGNNIGAGIDVTATRQSGGSAVTILGFGPKLVTAFRIHDSPVYPYVGAGYNLFVVFSDNKDAATMHVIKGGLGVLVEVADHLAIPLEFTFGFPLGEYSEMTMYRFTIGLAILGY